MLILQNLCQYNPRGNPVRVIMTAAVAQIINQKLNNTLKIV